MFALLGGSVLQRVWEVLEFRDCMLEFGDRSILIKLNKLPQFPPTVPPHPPGYMVLKEKKHTQTQKGLRRHQF